MRKALFVISIYQFSRETFPVLEYFVKKGWDAHVLVGFSGSTADTYIEQCRNAGLTVHRVPEALRFGDPFSHRAKLAVSGTPSQCGGLVHRLLALWRLIRRFQEVKEFARIFLSFLKPDVVLGGPFHSCGMFDDGIAWYCSHKKILYCCLTVSAYLGEKNAVGARFSNIANGMLPRSLEANYNLRSRILARLFPYWTRTQNGKTIFMFDPFMMLAAWLSGLLPQNPWQTPSELYDLVFAESEFSRDLLVGSQYDPAKVVVAGKPLLDQVFEKLQEPQYRTMLYHDLDLRSDEPFVLVNVEPAAEHRYASWEEHWSRFHAVMDALKKTGVKAILSLHPLCHSDDYAFVEEQYGFKVSNKWTIAELYPYCSLSVSFPCSTNLLAPIFKKRLLIYDFMAITSEDSPRKDMFRLPGALYAYNYDALYRQIQAERQMWGCKASVLLTTHPGDGYRSVCETILTHISAQLEKRN